MVVNISSKIWAIFFEKSGLFSLNLSDTKFNGLRYSQLSDVVRAIILGNGSRDSRREISDESLIEMLSNGYSQ